MSTTTNNMDFNALVQEVWRVNCALPAAGLVTATSGNASGIDRAGNRIVIKPSGVEYAALCPEDMAVVDATSGAHLGGKKPSVDLRHHVLLYQKDVQLGGVIHTHSNYATAFAAVGRAIPCVLTAIADEFGAEIPCAPYADNVDDHIAGMIMQHRGRGPAILLRHHGVFTFAGSPAAALKAAIMVEDAARTVWLAQLLGTAAPLPPGEIEKWWGRYHATYGQ
jgi:L-ribulose-5-phosphate 4-epimerase